MIRALLKAVKAKFDTDTGVSGLSTATGGRLFLSRSLDREPGGTTSKLPFLLVEVVSEAPLGEFAAQAIERVRLQFSVYDSSDGNSPDTCSTVIGKLRALFDGARLDLTGDDFTHAEFVREGGTGPRYVDEQWMATTDYIAVFAAA